MNFNLLKYKILIIVFFGGLVAGSLITNLAGYNVVKTWGIFNSTFINRYSSVSIDFWSMWNYIFVNRLKLFTVIVVASFTAITYYVFAGYMFYIGLSSGMVLSAMTMQYGLKGVGVFAVSIFPHFILYVGSVVLIEIKALSVRQKQQKVKADASMIIIITIALVMLFVGSLFETYINSSILRKILINL